MITRGRARLVLLLVAAQLGGCSDGEEDDERIRSYDVALHVQDDGSVQVTETIGYFFTGGERHGIERDIPQRQPHAQEQDRLTAITDVEVDSPTGAPTDLDTEADGGSLVLRIGDEDVEVTGDQVYVISYRAGAVARSTATGDEIRWDAVGRGWDVPVDTVSVRLTAPEAPTSSACVVGEAGSTDRCDVEPDGEAVVATATDLAEHEGVTLTAVLPAGTVGTEPVLRDSFSPARAFSVSPLPLGAALVVLLALLVPVLLRVRRGRRTPSLDVQTAARLTKVSAAQQLADRPVDARPAQLGTLFDGRADAREVTATLFDLAGRGLLHVVEADVDPAGAPVDRGDDDPPVNWRVVRTAQPLPPDLRPYEAELLDVLFTDGDDVLTSALYAERSRGLARVHAAMHRDVVELGWFTADPALVRRRWFATGLAVLAAGAVLTVPLAVLTSFALTGVAVSAAGLVLVLVAHLMPVRTAAGARVLEQTRRYREALASASPDTALVQENLADAVALGVATAWREQLERSGTGPPAWYASSSGLPGSAATWPWLFVLTSSGGAPASTGTSGSTGVGSGAGGGGGGSW